MGRSPSGLLRPHCHHWAGVGTCVDSSLCLIVYHGLRELDCSSNSHRYTIPGTSKQISIVYYNARSLVPKYDELCASTVTYKPDISIVETWLNKDISNEELDIPGFMLHHKDRRRHGRGCIDLYS